MKRSRKSTNAPSTASEWPFRQCKDVNMQQYLGDEERTHLESSFTPSYETLLSFDTNKQPSRFDSEMFNCLDRVNCRVRLASSMRRRHKTFKIHIGVGKVDFAKLVLVDGGSDGGFRSLHFSRDGGSHVYKRGVNKKVGCGGRGGSCDSASRVSTCQMERQGGNRLSRSLEHCWREYLRSIAGPLFSFVCRSSSLIIPARATFRKGGKGD